MFGGGEATTTNHAIKDSEREEEDTMNTRIHVVWQTMAYVHGRLSFF